MEEGEVGGDVEENERGQGAEQDAVGAEGVAGGGAQHEEYEGPSEGAEHVVARVDMAVGEGGAAHGNEAEGADGPERQRDRDPFAAESAAVERPGEQRKEEGPEVRGDGGLAEGERRAEENQPVVEDRDEAGPGGRADVVAGVEVEADEENRRGERAGAEPADEPGPPALPCEHQGADAPRDKAMREGERGQQGEDYRGEPAAARAAGKTDDARAGQQDHLEVVDRGAGPLEVFVVLELEKQKGEEHAQEHAAGGGAGRVNQQAAEGADEQIADGADDHEVDGARRPIARGEEEAAGERAVLVAQREKMGEDLRHRRSLIKPEQEEEGGIELVPVGDVARHEKGAGEDEAHRHEGDRRDREHERPLGAEDREGAGGNGHAVELEGGAEGGTQNQAGSFRGPPGDCSVDAEGRAEMSIRGRKRRTWLKPEPAARTSV